MKSLKELMEEYESPTGIKIEDLDSLGFGKHATKIGDFYTKGMMDEEYAIELFDRLVRTAYRRDNLQSPQEQIDRNVRENLEWMDKSLECLEMSYDLKKQGY